MTSAPDHGPTINEESGVVSWTDAKGRKNHLHTDPEESAWFLSSSNALAAGRDDLRVILDATAIWLESVTEAGLPPAEAVGFIKARIDRELEQLARLLVDGRLAPYVERLIAEGLDPDEED